MATTAIMPLNGTTSLMSCSSSFSKKAKLKIISTFTVSRMCLCLKNHTRAYPQATPTAAPRVMDTGTERKLVADTDSPFKSARNAAKVTSTYTSSSEAPAKSIWGIPRLTPRFSSRILSMRGTTTAGDTAAMVDPIRAASQ